MLADKVKLKQFILDVKNFMTYKDIGKKYGVPIYTAHRLASRVGFPRKYRQTMIRERREMLLVNIQKDMCTLPNFAEYCRRKKLSYFGIMGGSTNFRVKKIKCYMAERQKCRVCGAPKSEKSFKRLCEIHLLAYNRKKVGGLTRRRTIIREIGKERL